MIIEMTILEIGLALGIILCLILFIMESFRVDVLYKLVWKIHQDMSEQVEDLVEHKEMPEIHMVRAWREGLANSKKNSAEWHAYRNRLNEYGLL